MQCNAKTKNGEQCKNKVQAGSEYCKRHQDVSEETPEQIVQAISKAYDMQVRDTMGNLHNSLVGAVRKSGLPIPYTLIVIEMLRDEMIEAAKGIYKGK